MNNIDTDVEKDLQNILNTIHVYPTYAVKIPYRAKCKPTASTLEKANETRKAIREQNEKFFAETGQLPPVLSTKAISRLKNSINWLIASAKTKTVFSKTTGKSYSFKVNFITLTLPSLDHGISDAHFKSKLLHNFINTCRHSFGMYNFVWKVECQENGNIHAHLTTDVFTDWKKVRSIWNKILLDNGAMEGYIKKHSTMSLEDYNLLYNKDGNKSMQQIELMYNSGVSCGWKNPNTTDVHAVHKVKDLGAYLAKYFGKNEENRRRIKGRVWSCSYSLSSKNKLILEEFSQISQEFSSQLNKPDIKSKEILVENKTTGKSYSAGCIYFYKISDWGKILQSELLEEFNKFRFRIRNNLVSKYWVDDTPDQFNEIGIDKTVINLDQYVPS